MESGRRPFGAAEILALARKPGADIRMPSGSGFSYPQRLWMYESVAAYLDHGRNSEAMWSKLDERMTGGGGRTAWKAAREPELRTRLAWFLKVDLASQTEFEALAYVHPGTHVLWRGHDLRLPLGLIFAKDGGRALRLLWMEKGLRARRKGIVPLLAATLAVGELQYGRFEAIETWHLEAHEQNTFGARDLRANWPRLDRILTAAEARRAQ